MRSLNQPIWKSIPSLETFTSIIRTDLPILMELIDLVNSVIIFLSQMTLLRWSTSLFGSQTVILIVLLFWIYFFSVANKAIKLGRTFSSKVSTNKAEGQKFYRLGATLDWLKIGLNSNLLFFSRIHNVLLNISL